MLDAADVALVEYRVVLAAPVVTPPRIGALMRGRCGLMAGTAMGGVGRTFKQIGIIRLLVTIGLLVGAFAIARYSWDTPLISDAERALYDIRFDR